MNIVIRKKTGEIVMRCAGDIVVDEELFDVVSLNPSKQEMDHFIANDVPTYKKGELSFEKNPATIKEETKVELESFKEKARQGNLSANEIQQVLAKLL